MPGTATVSWLSGASGGGGTFSEVVRWPRVPSATEYEIGYSTTSQAVGDRTSATLYGTKVSGITDNTYTLTGLSAATYIAVRAKVGGTFGNWGPEMWVPNGGWAGSYADYPDETDNGSTIGVPSGTSLTTSSGTFFTSSDNQVIDARDITGFIYVQHNNVTIKRTRITATGQTYGIYMDTAVSVLIEDCELDGGGTPGSDIAAAQFLNGGTRVTVRRCWFKNSSQHLAHHSGISLSWNLMNRVAGNDAAHTENMYCSGYGSGGYVFRRNAMYQDGIGPDDATGNFNINTTNGDVTSMMFYENYIANSAAFYQIYANDRSATGGAAGALTGLEFIDNKMTGGEIYDCATATGGVEESHILTWTNNRKISDNSVISLPAFVVNV